MTREPYQPTILVVDDEATIRKVISRLLERAGYRVRTAGTGEEALNLVRQHHFDAAICDLRMAGTSGAVLCERIWNTAPDLAGKLIVASGDLTGDGVDALVDRSGVPPVSKPFTAEDLLRAVAAICPAPQPAAPPEGRRVAS